MRNIVVFTTILFFRLRGLSDYNRLLSLLGRRRKRLRDGANDTELRHALIYDCLELGLELVHGELELPFLHLEDRCLELLDLGVELAVILLDLELHFILLCA